MLGWLQLATAFGFPVTAPAGMLDRVFGADREAGTIGWAVLLLGLGAFVAFYFLVIERRIRGSIPPIAFTAIAWLLSGAVVMPVVGLLQGAAPAGSAPADPMRASFFMLSLGLGAAGETLIGWLLCGAVLAAGAAVKVGAPAFASAVGAAVLAAAVALAAPALVAPAEAGRVVDGRLAAIPAGPIFISVLELPQPPGAVLGPHRHVAGFVLSTSGIATMVSAGNVVDVGPGDAVFTPDNVLHDHENRAGVPLAIVLALGIVALTVATLVGRRHRRTAVAVMAALLVAGTVATIDPLMNDWYFIGVRPATARGAAMPVPAGHRTYESDDLTGLPAAPFRERLTDRRLEPGAVVRVIGPAAIVVLDGQVSVSVDGRATRLTARSGSTIAGGADAMVQSASGTARVLVVQVLPDN